MGVIINTPPKGSATKLIATASAYQTYATQLNYLYTYYQQLTLEEKLKSVLVRDDNIVSILRSINHAVYTNEATNAGNIYGESYQLSDGGHLYGSTGTSAGEQSSAVNPSTIKLYVLG